MKHRAVIHQVIVNLEGKEEFYTPADDDTIPVFINWLMDRHPDWTSLVITVVKRPAGD